LKNFKGIPQELNLPSAPERPVIVRDEIDRPQPRLDRDNYGGMAVTVGRIREDEVLDIKKSLLSRELRMLKTMITANIQLNNTGLS